MIDHIYLPVKDIDRSLGGSSKWRRGQRAPRLRPQFGDRYYAANLLDPDGYSLEICFKPWLYDGSDPVSKPGPAATN
jgi:hypothetical protein